jgi:hypothetical protein
MMLLRSAQFINSSDTVSGRIGYTSTVTDANDYFETALPIYGTFKLYIDYINTSNSTGSDIYFYVYNKGGGLIGSSSQVNQPLGASQDSIIVYCREQDTVYIRIAASGCFSYQFYYQVDAPTTNDAEPNNDFASAQPVSSTSATGGRIGYTSVQSDQNDYFLAALPTFGTLNFYLQYDNTSNSTGADLYAYIYNKGGGLIGSSSLTNQPLGVGFDTITVNCRELDTVYFRLNASGCFSYSFTYDVFAPTTNDIEPNNSFADAKPFSPNDTLGGRIAYVSTGTDQNDYFYSVLPEDGTIKYFIKYFNTSGSTGSDLYSYIYNKGGGLIGSSAKVNQPLGMSTDSISINCRAKDTVYFRIAASGCFSYKIYYEMDVPTPTDSSGNDAFASAQAVSFGDTTYGRIGYTSTSTDQNDYFLTVLPDDGTLEYIVEYTNTSGSTGSDYYTYIYNKGGGLIASSSKVNQALGAHVDTILVHCRAADTVYLRTTSSGCFSYKFYQNVLISGAADVEPNNTAATADSIVLNNTLQGRIGYASALSDPDDYFIFNLPEYSNITAYLTFNNTSNSTGSDFYVYLYNSGGGLVFNKSYANNQLGITTDTLNMDCLPGGDYTLRIFSSGCFSYEMDFEVENQQPEGEIFETRVGNTFSFYTKTSLTDSIFWDFDDGTTSSLALPIHDFAIGYYEVVLEAINKSCNLTAYDTLILNIDGIESYTPRRAGVADGFGQTIMRVFGGGLDTMAKVTLTQGGTTLQPKQLNSDGKSELTLWFDLAGAPLGKYDVNFELSSGSTFSFPSGFEVFQDVPGFNLKTELSGPSRIRTNVWSNFKLTISNDRNRIAQGAVALVAVPTGMETNLRDIIYTRDTTLKIDATAYGKLTIPQNVFNETYFDGTFNPNLDTFSVNLTEIYEYVDTVVGIPVDTLFDVPWSGTVYHLLIPFIDAQGSYSIDFKVRGTSNGNREMISMTWPYNMRINPISGKTLDNIHDAGKQAAALAAVSPIPALRAVGKSAGYVDIGSQVAFTEFFDWYYGVNNADAEFYAKQTLSLGAEVAGELVPFGDRYKGGLDKIKATKNNIKNGTKHIKYTEDMVKGWNVNDKVANRLKGDIADLTAYVNANKDVLSETQMRAAMDALKDYASAQGINLTNSQLQNLIFPDNPCTNDPPEKKPKPVRTLTSFDPNEIYGPDGYTSNRYLPAKSPLDYLVTFENVDTAKAPAAEVRVELNLNPSKYDLKRTTLGNVTIAGEVYYVEANRQSFFRDIDLRPRLNIIVRLNAALDTVTGDITWIFTSLDPQTLEVVYDPLLGFLPPNVSLPEGEGSVSFNTYMRADLQHLDSLSTIAEIFFDANEPILTSTWTNIIDEKPPTSTIANNVQVSGNNLMTFTPTASDANSGVRGFKLFVKLNEDDWLPNALPLNYTPTFTIEGSPGTTYSLYLEAIDSVGNAESKPQTPDIVYTLPGEESNFNPSFTVYPNPNQGDFGKIEWKFSGC